MASEYPSSNPFRRKAPASKPASTSAPADHPSIVNHIAYQQTDPQHSTNPSNVEAPKKATKKVRVQSPPPPSPSIPDSSSTIGENAYSISAKPPTPIPRDENDPFDSTTEDTSDDEGILTSAQVQAPANPFQKTLETMEHPERERPVVPTANATGSVKVSLDVDAFKRLLLTGDSGLGVSTPTASQAPVHHGLGDGGSSTDTSSISRQSIFEPIHETTHSESPRTSHEISEPEDDSRGLTAEVSTAGRKKPPPPSSRHGKLIKVELRDDPSLIPLASPRTPSSSSSNQLFNSTPAQHSQTDLNKPLPPAPARDSHDSEDGESIFDKESAGKTPEPPSPSASLRRRTPPAPPLTRRQSQKVTASKFTTRVDTGRLASQTQEDPLKMVSARDIGIPRSDSARAPPPPPTRRPASVRGMSQQVPLTSPSTSSLPPVPPVRGSSKTMSGRPPSVASMDIPSSPIPASNAPSKRASMLPPPPPPPPARHGRTSMEEGSRRTSSDHSRRSIDSARRGSETSSPSRMTRVESPESVGGNGDGQFILAEMTRLQKEIDDMRAKSERVT